MSESAQAGNLAPSDNDMNSALTGNVAQVRVIGSALSGVESTGNKAYSDLVKSLNIEDDAPTGHCVSDKPRIPRRVGNDAYSELVKSLNIEAVDDAPARQESGNVASAMLAPHGNIALGYIPAGVINVQQIARSGNVALPNIYYKPFNPAFVSNPAPAAKEVKVNDEPCRLDVIFVESKPLPKETTNVDDAPEIDNPPIKRGKPNATGKVVAETSANDVKETNIAPTDNAAQMKTVDESETDPPPNKIRKSDLTIDDAVKDCAKIEEDAIKAEKLNIKKLTTVKIKSGITFTTLKPVKISPDNIKKIAFAQKAIKGDEKDKKKVIITKLSKVDSSKTIAKAMEALKRKQDCDLSQLDDDTIIIVDSPEIDVEACGDSLELDAIADKPKISPDLAKILSEESKAKLSITNETHILTENNSKTVLQESTQDISDLEELPLDSTDSNSAAMSETSNVSTKALTRNSETNQTFSADMPILNISETSASSTESKSILRDKMPDSWSDSAMVAADSRDVVISPRLWAVTTDCQDTVVMSSSNMRDPLASVSLESIKTPESRKSSDISKSKSVSIASSSELSPSSVSESTSTNNTQDSQDLPERSVPDFVNVESPKFYPNYIKIKASSPKLLQDQQTSTNTNVKSLKAATLSVLSESSSDMPKSSVKSTADSASMISSPESTSDILKSSTKSPSDSTSVVSSPKTQKSPSNPVSPASLPESPSDKPESPSKKPVPRSDKPESPSDNPESRSEKPETPSDNPESRSEKPESPSDNPESSSEKPELARQHSEASREPSEPDQMTMEPGIRRGDSSMPVLVF